MIHEIKILPIYFNDVENGSKKSEIREYDRPYKVGDYLHLREWHDGYYTGRENIKRITHILTDIPEYGLREGYLIMSIE